MAPSDFWFRGVRLNCVISSRAWDGAGGVISSYLTRVNCINRRLGCVIGVKERYWVVNWILCTWISRNVGWSNPGLMSMLAVWLIYSGMCWHLHQQEAVKQTKKDSRVWQQGTVLSLLRLHQHTNTHPRRLVWTGGVVQSVVCFWSPQKVSLLDVWIQHWTCEVFHIRINYIRWLKIWYCWLTSKIATLGNSWNIWWLEQQLDNINSHFGQEVLAVVSVTHPWVQYCRWSGLTLRVSSWIISLNTFATTTRR